MMPLPIYELDGWDQTLGGQVLTRALSYCTSWFLNINPKASACPTTKRQQCKDQVRCNNLAMLDLVRLGPDVLQIEPTGSCGVVF